MFSRLASLNEGFDNQQIYDDESSFYKQLPYIVATNNPIPPDITMNQAVSSLTSSPSIPRDITTMFTSKYSSHPEIAEKQQGCTSAQKIDDVMNNAKSEQCGWFYAPPPTPTSWVPQFSKAWLSTTAGPVGLPGAPTPDDYMYFYHDKLPEGQKLADGKKQMLKDLCMSVTNCTDLGFQSYSGICGWCPEGKAVPINKNGTVMYPEPGIACANVVTKHTSCPKPASNAVVDPKACVGPFSRECLSTILSDYKCDKGTLNDALTSSFNPNNTDVNSQNIGAMKAMTLYNQQANTPFNIRRFLGADTGAMKQESIAEVMKIANAVTASPATSAVGASARSLCVSPGAMDQYNFCNDLSVRPTSGWPLTCLQQAFRKAGGTINGTGYPNTTTPESRQAVDRYNTFTNWVDVNNDMNKTYSIARGVTTEGFVTSQPQFSFDAGQNIKNTNAQSAALKQMMGIDAGKLGSRPPYSPGVEVFWRNGYRIVDYTVEPEIPVIDGEYKRSAVKPGPTSNLFIALTDVRSTTTQVGWMQTTAEYGNKTASAINGPMINEDSYNNAGLIGYAGYNQYTPGPNILQVQWRGAAYASDDTMIRSNVSEKWQITQKFDTGGSEPISNRSKTLKPSLAREVTGPFIMLEPIFYNNKKAFTDIRLPGVIEGPFVAPFSNSTQTLAAPGKNGYMTLANKNYYMLFNLMMPIIKQMTFVFRINAVGLNKNYLFNFACGSDDNKAVTLVGYVTRNGNQPYLVIAYDINGKQSVLGQIKVNIDQWTMGVFTNDEFSWCISINSIDSAKSTRFDWTAADQSTTVKFSSPSGFRLVNPSPQLHGFIAGISPTLLTFASAYNDSAFSVDIAWIHVFNRNLNASDLQREAKNNWLIATPAQN